MDIPPRGLVSLLLGRSADGQTQALVRFPGCPFRARGLATGPGRDAQRPAWRHKRVSPSLGECLLYPLADGPGLGLLIFFPPILWVLSLPIFDIIAVLEPLKGDWKLGLMVVPVMVPVIFSFSMVFGYALVFLGHFLVSSAWVKTTIRAGPSGTPPISPKGSAAGSGRVSWARDRRRTVRLFLAEQRQAPVVPLGHLRLHS